MGLRLKVGMTSDTMPNAGQDQDVDLGVAEDPEEVLPQQRIGALGHVEEVGVEEPVEGQQDQGHGDDRQGEHQQELDHEDHPGEDRHLHEVHARRPHVEDRHGQVDGADQRGDAGDDAGPMVKKSRPWEGEKITPVLGA